MLFKELQPGHNVHILNKADMTYKTGKVISKSFPRIDSINPGNSIIDITIESEGNRATYAIPETISTTYAGQLVISTSECGLVKEIEIMKSKAEEIIQNVDMQKAIIEKSEKLLAELNPVYKDKIATENRFSKIEGSLGELKDMISGLVRELKS